VWGLLWGKNNILRRAIQGQVTDEGLQDAYEAAEKYVALHGPYRAIWDFSRVTQFDVSTEAIREIAQKPPIVPSGYMRVLVAPQDFLYGLTRMFQILSERNHPDLHVVRTMDEAYTLLRVKSPEFSPISIPT
jgi:hypothetical protein